MYSQMGIPSNLPSLLRWSSPLCSIGGVILLSLDALILFRAYSDPYWSKFALLALPLCALAMVLIGAGQTLSWRRIGGARRILAAAAIALGIGIFVAIATSIQVVH
jgi:hypothetical protein